MYAARSLRLVGQRAKNRLELKLYETERLELLLDITPTKNSIPKQKLKPSSRLHMRQLTFDKAVRTIKQSLKVCRSREEHCRGTTLAE